MYENTYICHAFLWSHPNPGPLSPHTKQSSRNNLMSAPCRVDYGTWYRICLTHLYTTMHTYETSASQRLLLYPGISLDHFIHCGWWQWKSKRILIKYCWRIIPIASDLPVSKQFVKFIRQNWMCNAMLRTYRNQTFAFWNLSSHCTPKVMLVCAQWAVIV